MIPVVESERLILRAPKMADYEQYSAFWKSKRAKAFGGPYSDQEIWDSFAADNGHWMIRGFGHWFAESKSSGDCIGWMGFFFPLHYSEAELGWTLFEPFLGQGFATEGGQTALDYGRRHFGIPEPVSYIETWNDNSISVAKRLGATLEDTRDNGDGPFHIFRHKQKRGLAA